MPRIFVHSGQFHADDVFCVAILKTYFVNKFEVIRVRELPKDYNSSYDVAVDVGSKFDINERIFDHHFKGGNDDGMAACGKLWSTIGHEICDDDKRIADRVYLTVLASIDRADIGVKDWEPINDELRHLSASGLIACMNPPFGSSEDEIMEAFEAAVNAAKFALKGSIAYAKSYIEMSDVIDNSTKLYDGKLMVLSKGGPWQEHVFDKNLDELLYVIYPSDRGGYMIQCVPDAPNSFGQRKPLPKNWSGLRGQEFANLLKSEIGFEFEVGSLLFCHPACFIAGAENLNDAIRMANFAIS